MIRIAAFVFGGGFLVLTILWWLVDLFPNAFGPAVDYATALFTWTIVSGCGFALCALYFLRWVDARNRQRMIDLHRPLVRRPRDTQAPVTLELPSVPTSLPRPEVPSDVEVT